MNAMTLSDRERKLLLLAFDSSSSAGEVMNALRVFFGLDPQVLGRLSAGEGFGRGEDRRSERVSPYGKVVLGFGNIGANALKMSMPTIFCGS